MRRTERGLGETGSEAVLSFPYYLESCCSLAQKHSYIFPLTCIYCSTRSGPLFVDQFCSFVDFSIWHLISRKAEGSFYCALCASLIKTAADECLNYHNPTATNLLKCRPYLLTFKMHCHSKSSLMVISVALFTSQKQQQLYAAGYSSGIRVCLV